MEKLTFKSKFTQYLSLASVVGAGVLTLIAIINSLIMLFMDLGNDDSVQILTYVCLGFVAVALITFLVILGIFFRTVKHGIKKNTFQVLDVTRLVISGTLIIFALLFFIDNAFVKAAGDEIAFFKIASIATFAIEVVALLYRIWRMLWTKENPDRIYNTYVLKEPDCYGEEGDVKEITQDEIKQIEKRK